MKEFYSDTLRQIDIIKTRCLNIKPKLAIECIAFNQDAYIREALEGFVMQQTNFPFVAIVHDDASTDGTVAIIREYAERYPDIILPIYEEKNQYSRKNRILTRIMAEAIKATGCEYVALCEGDDYWTDPLKLQKQVDFLDAHPDYSMCFHYARILQIDGTMKDNGCAIDSDREYTADEITENWCIPTASVVYRAEKILGNPILFNKNFKYGDNVLFLTCAKYGKLFGMTEIMSVYRKNPTGITMRLINAPWLKLDVVHYRTLNKVFADILSRRVRREALATRYYYLMRQVKNKPLEFIRYTAEGIWFCTPEIWKYLFGSVKRKTRLNK